MGKIFPKLFHFFFSWERELLHPPVLLFSLTVFKNPSLDLVAFIQEGIQMKYG